MDTIKQTPHTIEFINTFSPLERVLLALFALVPLLAPYELLIKSSWQGQVSFDWIIPLVISIGAVVVSLLLFLAALVGRHERFLFDASKRQLTYQFKTAFNPGSQEIYSFDQIESLEVRVIEWDERPDTYGIAVKIAGKPDKMGFGNYPSRSDAERYLTVLQTMLAKRK